MRNFLVRGDRLKIKKTGGVPPVFLFLKIEESSKIQVSNQDLAIPSNGINYIINNLPVPEQLLPITLTI